jgi:hypothetical protein
MLSHQLLSRLGAIPVSDNLFLCRVLFLHRGKTQELLPHQGLGILGRDPVPSSGMPIWGNSFHNQWNPRQGTMPIPMGSAWGNPSQSPLNVMHAQPSTSYFGNQPMMSPHMQNPYTSHGHGFYQNPGQQQTFPGNLVPVKLQVPFSMVITNNPNYLSWKPCICQT